MRTNNPTITQALEILDRIRQPYIRRIDHLRCQFAICKPLEDGEEEEDAEVVDYCCEMSCSDDACLSEVEAFLRKDNKNALQKNILVKQWENAHHGAEYDQIHHCYNCGRPLNEFSHNEREEMRHYRKHDYSSPLTPEDATSMYAMLYHEENEKQPDKYHLDMADNVIKHYANQSTEKQP